jgi:ribosomal protein S10
MNYEAKITAPWDLSDPKTIRSTFVSRSFYVVIDGIRSEAVQAAAKLIKQALHGKEGTRVRGPLALKTERRRYMVLRELGGQVNKGLFVSRPKRIRNVLLVENPSAIGISAMISLPIPKSVNVKIEPYEHQYELKESN